jgi:hypothetical protein
MKPSPYILAIRAGACRSESKREQAKQMGRASCFPASFVFRRSARLTPFWLRAKLILANIVKASAHERNEFVLAREFRRGNQGHSDGREKHRVVHVCLIRAPITIPIVALDTKG